MIVFEVRGTGGELAGLVDYSVAEYIDLDSILD